MPDPDFERKISYIGGPWDGQARWEPKAFWPPQNQKVDAAGGLTGAWPDVWPADEPRYMPEITSGVQVRMIWAAPDDDHAPALIPRPESIKDYGGYDED
ncbi:hypothetical protein OHB04_02415 [Streptomyces sp. NBC_01775]|uniref:hypothetical protein n=1 Tax=Streptomyces sp. NBC_01775 TaxID=2975939 RepID=UPI002DDA2DFB|nr:hypothetical protein [Streptomyces sp. NBC_01775]WSB74747.1 hypothetical protein OHB04_02415 [Streptomyces sp. NBC_01775]